MLRTTHTALSALLPGGVLGGSSLDKSNLIDANSIGISFNGTIQYNRITRNNEAIALESRPVDRSQPPYLPQRRHEHPDQRLPTFGSSTTRSTRMPETIIEVIDSSPANVQVLNNILWDAFDTIFVSSDASRTRILQSDYTDLYTTGSGRDRPLPGGLHRPARLAG